MIGQVCWIPDLISPSHSLNSQAHKKRRQALDRERIYVQSSSFVLPPTMLYYSSYLEYVQNFNQVKDLPLLRPELVRHGYSSADIAKILGGNWMRVFRHAWN